MKEEENGAERVKPYDAGSSKGRQVERMFDSIAPAYDFMNGAMSFGLHRYWRDRALKALRALVHDESPKILDVATGTGDVAFRLLEMFPEGEVTGLDLSEGMLGVARRKLARMDESFQSRVRFEQGDSLNLKYDGEMYDAVTVAYGVRNFENLRRGFSEMYRVLRPGGVLCVIELARPDARLTGAAYDIYARHVIPTVGRLVSGDSRAYTYLPESIAAAPQRDALIEIMRESGFRTASWRQLTFGAVCIYLAVK